MYSLNCIEGMYSATKIEGCIKVEELVPKVRLGNDESVFDGVDIIIRSW